MSFKKDIPNYKSYSEEKYYMKTAPSTIWPELQGLISRCSSSAPMLKIYLNRFAEIIPCDLTTNWGWDFLVNDITDFVYRIRKKTNDGHFHILMDCLATLVDDDEKAEEINEFLEVHNIGYICSIDPFNKHVNWCVKDESDIVEEMSATKTVVKSASQQAYDEFDNAITSLKNSTNERSRKDAVRSCVSAMEAVVKVYGKTNEIGEATKNLRAEGIWGLEEIVKEGNAIFNTMHRIYPDLRHGSTESSTMSLEEAEYWIGRISNFLKYMQKMAKQNGR